MSSSTDSDVRLHIYERFVEDGRPPSVEESAAGLGLDRNAVAGAYRRLEAAHVIVLAPGTLNVWMANPLSAVPTSFRVQTGRGDYWGNCVWDGLGVIAMLGQSGAMKTACADCGEPMAFRVDRGGLVGDEGVAHFAVPARHWWDNIGFT